RRDRRGRESGCDDGEGDAAAATHCSLCRPERAAAASLDRVSKLRRVSKVALLLSLVALAVVSQSAAFQHFGAGCSRDDFRSRGSSVRAELCRANGASSRAVVVLHGCGGFSTFDHRLATELPRLGISTLDVDYFELTPPPGRKGFCGFHGGTDPFPTWV